MANGKGRMTATEMGLPDTAWTKMFRATPAAQPLLSKETRRSDAKKGISAAEFKRRHMNLAALQRAEKGSKLRQHLSQMAADGVPGAGKLLRKMAVHWDKLDATNVVGTFNARNSKPGAVVITKGMQA